MLKGIKSVDINISNELQKYQTRTEEYYNKSINGIEVIDCEDIKVDLETMDLEEYRNTLDTIKENYQNELDNINILLAALEYKTMDYKEWVLKYKGTYDINELISKANEVSNSNIQDTINQLKQDKALFETTIYKLEQLEKMSEYDYLDQVEEYQNYTGPTGYSEEELNKINYEELFTKAYEGNLESYCRVKGIDINKIDLEAFYDKARTEYSGGYDNYCKDTDIANLYELGNEDYIKKYNYYLDKYGEEKASEYLNNMKDAINEGIGAKRAAEYLSTLKVDENGNYDISISGRGILNHLNVALKGGHEGFDSFFEGTMAWFKKEHVYSTSEYEVMYIVQALKENKKLSNVLDNVFELSQSMGNMLPGMIIGAAGGMAGLTKLGAITVGTSAGGNSYHSAMASGNDRVDALIYGVLSGASEATLEHYLGSLPGLGEVDVKSFKTWLKAIFKEGNEEALQEYIDGILSESVLGEDIDQWQLFLDALKSAGYGATMGGITNGVKLGAEKIINGNTNTPIIEETKIENKKDSNNTLEQSITNIEQSQKLNNNNIKRKTSIVGENTTISNIDFHRIFENMENAIQIMINEKNLTRYQALKQIEKTINTNDFIYITSKGNARNNLSKYSIKELKIVYDQIKIYGESTLLNNWITSWIEIENITNDIENAIQIMMDKKNLTRDQALRQIEETINTNDFIYITGEGNARNNLSKYSIENLRIAYNQIMNNEKLTSIWNEQSQNDITKEIENAIQIMMDKKNFTRDQALRQIEETINTNDFIYITSEGNARNNLRKYSIEELKIAYNQIKNNDSPLDSWIVQNNQTTYDKAKIEKIINEYTIDDYMKMGNDDFKEFLNNITPEDLNKVLYKTKSTFMWSTENFAKFFYFATDDQINILLQSHSVHPGNYAEILEILAKGNVDLNKYIKTTNYKTKSILDYVRDKGSVIKAISDPNLVSYLIDDSKIGNDYDLLLFLDENDVNVNKKVAQYYWKKNPESLLTLLENYNTDEMSSNGIINIYKMLNNDQIEYLKNNLELTFQNKLINEYKINEFYNEENDKIVNYSEKDMINILIDKLKLYVPIERIQKLKGTCKFYNDTRFKKIYSGDSENVMGYNDGEVSVMNLKYDWDMLKSTIIHESIHELSANDNKTTSKRGLSIDGQNNGLDECITEYITEILMRDEYYTKKTGEEYCGYQEGVEKLKQVINTGVIEENKLIEAYFNNDIDYVKNKISNLCGPEFCEELLKNFDDAINDEDAIRDRALDDLDSKIATLQLKTKKGFGQIWKIWKR